jgi:1-acyl-sn-glycerol-3-phosphate acyltransferase
VGIANSIQRFGASLEISGFERARDLQDKPAVYVSNHMSPLETYLLAGVILGLGDAAAVMKTSLLKLPFIGPLLRASRPIALDRTDARKDLTQTLEQGQALIAEGRAIILFPEGTRRPAFEARRFNTLGEKLSARANVPLVPVAVDTRFQAPGKIKMFQDLGPIHPEHTVRIECGEPIPPGLPAKERHAAALHFIQERLLEWGVPVINSEQKETP